MVISFIVIGRNEAKNLRRCLTSVFNYIDVNGISDFEIIYVDSQSSDDSLEIAHRFKNVKTYQVTGPCNAAVGRNVGATVAKGDVFFFIDADMEIVPEFHSEVMTDDDTLKYPAVSGLIKDVENGVLTDVRYQKTGRSRLNPETLDGGIFLIRRHVWQQVSGMNTKFRTGEDGELGLRLANLNIPFTRINQPITLHHTISYHDKTRMWQSVWNKSIFYWRCVLYREHLFTKEMYALFWKNDKSLLFLLIVPVCSIFFPKLFFPLFLGYASISLLRSLKQRKFNQTLEFALYYATVDLLNIVFFFTFFPKQVSEKFMRIRQVEKINYLLKENA